MTEKEALSFGQYLKAVRLEKGIHLKTVSGETRIGMDILQGIEQEDHDRLPAEVYVKGFIRAYARVVGTDAEEAVRRYLASRHAHSTGIGIESDSFGARSNSRFRSLTLAALLIVFAALLIVGWVFFYSGNPDHDTAGGLPVAARAVQSSPVSEFSTGSGGTTITGSDRGSLEEKYLLDVMTVDNTMLKVIIDDKNPQEFSLKSGDRLELEASSRYELTIDNPSGVNLFLNGKAYPIPGKGDQTVTLSIP